MVVWIRPLPICTSWVSAKLIRETPIDIVSKARAEKRLSVAEDSERCDSIANRFVCSEMTFITSYIMLVSN